MTRRPQVPDASIAARDGHAAPARELDLRSLPAPEPLVRALDLADALAPGEVVAVLTPLVPAPLLELLEARGVEYRLTVLPDGAARVCMRRPAPARADRSHGEAAA